MSLKKLLIIGIILNSCFIVIRFSVRVIPSLIRLLKLKIVLRHAKYTQRTKYKHDFKYYASDNKIKEFDKEFPNILRDLVRIRVKYYKKLWKAGLDVVKSTIQADIIGPIRDTIAQIGEGFERCFNLNQRQGYICALSFIFLFFL